MRNWKPEGWEGEKEETYRRYPREDKRAAPRRICATIKRLPAIAMDAIPRSRDARGVSAANFPGRMISFPLRNLPVLKPRDFISHAKRTNDVI